jgi:hypothetical protein
MDRRTFDDLVRAIAFPSRRSVRTAAATAVVAALFGNRAADEAFAKGHKPSHRADARRHDRGRVQASRKKRRKKKCKGGTAKCGKQCVNTTSDEENCGTCGHACGARTTCCSGACVDTAVDENNCGECGNECEPDGSCQGGECVLACGGTICHFDNASAYCLGDTCALGSCHAGWVNCDGNSNTGCETDVMTDVVNCGGCNTRCNAVNGTPSCVGGTCGIRCHDGLADCDGSAYSGCEIDIRTNIDDCGGCNHECDFPNAVRSCQDGTCVMGECRSNRPAEWFPLFENCDGDPNTGCETDILSDPAHCGGCGQACPDGQVCWLGVCERPCGEGGSCRVFVTAVNAFRGNLGGLAGADAQCQSSAQNAGLPGTYMAWLSDDTESPSTRFLLKSTGPYRTVDGVTIANNWTDLTDGELAETIFVTETGYYPGNVFRVWTHTRPDGAAGGVGNAHCQNWSTLSYAEFGDAGFSGSSTAEWTEHSVTSCVEQKRLYCFQQSG